MRRIVNWKPLAERMTEEIGEWIETEPVRRAFAETPRHLFIARYFEWHNDMEAKETVYKPVEDPDPDHIYTNTAFVTQCQRGPSGNTTMLSTSSSSMPGLMADMIEELGIKPGMRVVESGTGTGYNAGILCHILGDQNVASVDIDPELVDVARQRLATLGYHPSFEPADNSYDRLLATHAVDNIPYEWVRWLKPGGVILTDFRARNPMSHISAWAVVTVDEGGRTATGKLIEPRGSFMGARTTPEHADFEDGPLIEFDWDRMHSRPAVHSKAVLDDATFEFFLWRKLPEAVLLRPWLEEGETEGPDVQRVVTTRDGRWTAVTDTEVHYMVPDDLWGEVEVAYDRWVEAGKPAIYDATIRVTEDGQTVVTF